MHDMKGLPLTNLCHAPVTVPESHGEGGEAAAEGGGKARRPGQRHRPAQWQQRQRRGAEAQGQAQLEREAGELSSAADAVPSCCGTVNRLLPGAALTMPG